MPLRSSIRSRIDQTPFVDTHEHLLEEATRLNPPAGGSSRALQTQVDFSVLLSHYADSDLVVAGMPVEALGRLADRDMAPRDKWRLVAPYYARARHTGYLRNVRESLRLLFEVDDLCESNCEQVSQAISAAIGPGYYRRILKDVARIECCHVNTLEAAVFMETAQPDLLYQDIGFAPLSSALNLTLAEKLTGRPARTLADWHAFIDWCFAAYGPRAIAAKNASAYKRRLDYDDVSAQDVAPLFAALVKGPDNVSVSQRKALGDHLFHYCVAAATACGLPVKLHTGYYARHNEMPLDRVRRNASDLCGLLQRHPGTAFIIMHDTYPYQDEAIALAKHYTNAYVDMCWAWIINPAAGVRFVKEFLMAAPANKLLTFGGDYMPVEMVPGHAAIARQGLAQALAELVEDHWLDESDLPDLVERLMRGNAHERFDHRRALAAWR